MAGRLDRDCLRRGSVRKSRRRTCADPANCPVAVRQARRRQWRDEPPPIDPFAQVSARTGLSRRRPSQRNRISAAVRPGHGASAAASPRPRHTIRRLPLHRLPHTPFPQFQDAMQSQPTAPVVGPDCAAGRRHLAGRPVAASHGKQLGLSTSRSSRSQRYRPRLLPQRPADRVVGHGGDIRRRGRYHVPAPPAVRRFRIHSRQRVLHQPAIRQRSTDDAIKERRSGDRTPPIFRSTSSRSRNWHW